jgi:hypothetical protein
LDLAVFNNCLGDKQTQKSIFFQPLIATVFTAVAGIGMAVVGNQLMALEESVAEEVKIVEEEIAGVGALLGPLLQQVIQGRR